MRNRTNRCVATAADGLRCGRRARPGSNPQLCSMHDGSTVTPVMPPPEEFDPTEKLKKIAANDNHAQQVQAIKILREDKQGCATCAERATSDDNNDTLVEHATDAEVTELRSLVARVKEIKSGIRKRIATGASAPTTDTPRASVTMPDGRIIYEISGFLDWCRRRAIPEEEYRGATWEQVIQWIEEAKHESA